MVNCSAKSNISNISGCTASDCTGSSASTMSACLSHKGSDDDSDKNCCIWNQDINSAGNAANVVGSTDYVARNCEEYQNLLKRGGICPAGETNCCPQNTEKMALMKPQDLRFYPLVAPYNTPIEDPHWTKDFRSRDSIIFPHVCEGTDECDEEHFAEICCKEGSKSDFLKNSIFPTYFHFYTMLVFLILGLAVGGINFFNNPNDKSHISMAKYGIITLFGMFGVAVGWHLISSSRYSFEEIKTEEGDGGSFSVGSSCDTATVSPRAPTESQKANGEGVRCASAEGGAANDNCLLIPQQINMTDADRANPALYECSSSIPITRWFHYAWNTTLSGKILAVILTLLIIGMIVIGVDRILSTKAFNKINPFGNIRSNARTAAAAAP